MRKHLYGFKYSYVVLNFQADLFDPLMEGTLVSTNTSGHCETVSNENEGVTPHSCVYMYMFVYMYMYMCVHVHK